MVLYEVGAQAPAEESRRHTREILEIADQVRLVEIAALDRDVGPARASLRKP